LKRLAEKYFGKEFANRKKMGLPSPLQDYFYEADFSQYMYEVIFPNIKRRGIFNYDYVKECYEKRINLSNVVWRALTFEIWAMMYIDEDGRKVLSYATT
jgi:asparagine synthetase B (glutamine-hydrolysing)